MRKTTMVAGLAVAAAAFAGAGHAAVVHIQPGLNLHLLQGDLVYNIATDDNTPNVSYYELVGRPQSRDSWTVADLPANIIIPFHDVVLGAKQQVLQFTPRPNQDSISNVSAVPLPGAIWLFGSAILGFLGFSKRRKL